MAKCVFVLITTMRRALLSCRHEKRESQSGKGLGFAMASVPSLAIQLLVGYAVYAFRLIS